LANVLSSAVIEQNLHDGAARALVTAPLAVVMISLNEAHHLEAVLDNLQGFAREVFLVDSYSSDGTVDLALRRGVKVVQRAFRGFGEQWNFALQELPISAPWTMKLDPDERLSERLKASVLDAIGRDPGERAGEPTLSRAHAPADAYTLDRRLWFLGKALPVRQRILRLWRTGRCRFSDVAVNEHPLVEGGRIGHLRGDLEHHDSPSLEHWYDKQNRYSTAEARAIVTGAPLSARAALLGTPLERQMWLKKHFWRLPLRYRALFWAHYLGQGAWRAGREGLVWARLRADVHRMIGYKVLEMSGAGRAPYAPRWQPGKPDPRVPQY
jgi:glycosyltransferase involved in cell wall biosynthesis